MCALIALSKAASKWSDEPDCHSFVKHAVRKSIAGRYIQKVVGSINIREFRDLFACRTMSEHPLSGAMGLIAIILSKDPVRKSISGIHSKSCGIDQ